MMLAIVNGVSHALHLLLIGFTLAGWAFESTRDLHLWICGLILASWFILGPIVGKPGFCVLTGLQHWIWRRTGVRGHDNYMSYLFRALTRREPTARGVKTIDGWTQAGVYAATLLSLVLRW